MATLGECHNHACKGLQRANVGGPPAPGTAPSSSPPPQPAICYTPPLSGSARSPKIPPTLGVPWSRLLGTSLAMQTRGVAPRKGRERARLTCSPRAEATTPPPRPAGPTPPRTGAATQRPQWEPRLRRPNTPIAFPGLLWAPACACPTGRPVSPARWLCACALRAPAAPAGQRTTRGARNPGSGGSAPKTPARRPGLPGSRSFLFPRPVLNGMGVLII